MTTLSAVNTAIDIARRIVTTEGDIEKAELKLRMAELLERLAEAKITVVEIQDGLRAKDEEIANLIEAFAFRDETIVVKNLHYRKTEQGDPIGLPFCPRCYEADRRWISMHHQRGRGIANCFCPQCKTEIRASGYS